jgi:hypothetical protein
VGFITILLCACDVLLSSEVFCLFSSAAHWLLLLFLASVLRHLISLLQFLFYWPDLLCSVLDQRILLIFFCHVRVQVPISRVRIPCCLAARDSRFLLVIFPVATYCSQLQVRFPHSVFSTAGCALDLVSSFCCRLLLGRWSLRLLLGLRSRLI